MSGGVDIDGTRVEDLLGGAVDTHIHTMPFINEDDLALDVFEAATAASHAGLYAIVVKPFFGSSCPIAYLANRYAGGAKVIGGVTLNFSTGGFNADAVRVAAHEGIHKGERPGRVVWMPERSARHRARLLGMSLDDQRRHLSPFIDGDPGRGLSPEATEVFEAIADADLVLATSHLSPEEGIATLEAASRLGVNRFLLTHASSTAVGYTTAQKSRAVELGAMIEESYLSMSSAMRAFRYDPADSRKAIFEPMRAIGPEHYVLSSDGGYALASHPVESMVAFMRDLLEFGFDTDELRRMVRDNPRTLLRLDVPDEQETMTRDRLQN